MGRDGDVGGRRFVLEEIPVILSVTEPGNTRAVNMERQAHETRPPVV